MKFPTIKEALSNWILQTKVQWWKDLTKGIKSTHTGTVTIPLHTVRMWEERLSSTPFSQLPDREKTSLRAEADGIIRLGKDYRGVAFPHSQIERDLEMANRRIERLKVDNASLEAALDRRTVITPQQLWCLVYRDENDMTVPSPEAADASFRNSKFVSSFGHMKALAHMIDTHELVFGRR